MEGIQNHGSLEAVVLLYLVKATVGNHLGCDFHFQLEWKQTKESCWVDASGW